MQPDKNTDNKTTTQAETSLASAYDRIVRRLSKSSFETADSSSAILKKMVDDAIELEQAAEEMTSDELYLLAEYVYRDMHLLAQYIHNTGEELAAWLNFDLNILEQSAKQQFLHLADQTVIDNLVLQEKLECSSEQYIKGEISTVGTLRCLNCLEEKQLRKTTQVLACSGCQGEYFERVSK